MTHALTSNTSLDDFHTTLFTGDAPIFHPLVFSTQAFIIFNGPKNSGTEQTVSFRLKSPVVDGLWLLYLAMRPTTDFLRRRETDSYRDVVKWIFWLVVQVVDLPHGDLLVLCGLSPAGLKDRKQLE
jgi:hypothetical protein